MATHSSILAWRIPGTEEPSGVTQSQTQLKQLSSSSSSSEWLRASQVALEIKNWLANTGEGTWVQSLD